MPPEFAEPQFQGPPESPMSPPQEPMMGGGMGGGMASPEQMAALQDLFAKVKRGASQISSQKFAMANRALSSKRDALKEVFAEMQANGVDLSDPTSVAQFLQKLQATDPDMYQLFQNAMDKLLNDNETQADPSEAALPEGLPGVS